MEKKSKKKKRIKLKIKNLVKVLFFLAVIIFSFYYLYNLKIKNIYIEGNQLISDKEIIEKAGIKNYPNIYKLNIKKVKREVEKIPLIEKVRIKRNIFGRITFYITEEKILFFYKYNNKFISSLGNSIDDSGYVGYPTLVNFVPDTIFESLVSSLNKVDQEVIKMINEIEYTPYKTQNGEIIDDGEFTLLMNDNNTVVIDLVNIRKLNDYTKIYASLKMDKNKGTLYLDTITEENIYFKTYETQAKETAEEEKKQDMGH